MTLKIAIAALTLVSAISAPAFSEPVAATQSDLLRQFVSIQTHLNWPKTVWSNTSLWQPALGALEVSQTRSAYTKTTSESANLAQIYSSYGIRSSATINVVKSDCTFDRVKAAAILSYMRDVIGPEKFYAVEGPNEYNQKCKTGAWATRLRDFQKWLYTTVKADPKMKNLTVLAPSIYKRIVAKYYAVGDISASADNGNLHYYNGANKPTVYMRSGAPASIDMAIADAQIMVPGKKVAVTETGYYVNEGSPTATQVPDSVASKYIPRLITELFRRRDKVSLVNVYTLIDDVGTNQYGLLRGSDLSKRSAYSAVQNLMSLVSDRGAEFVPGTLDYTLDGSLNDIGHFLLQKRDGRFLLVIWQDAVSYDTATMTEVTISPRPLSLNIADPIISTINIYYPTLGRDAAASLSNPAFPFPLAVPDHVAVLELVP